ncbi:MAG TPA: hypothetical protein VGK67_24085 [Myxococcales bacterium]|jgi:hypothetical protein
MQPPTHLLALALLCLAGCEEEIAVDVKVTVPVEVQALYSKAAPGRLLVGMDVPKSSVGWYSLGVLCEPAGLPLVANLHHEGRGCAKAGTVRAWIVPATEPAAQLSCGLATTRFDSATAATAATPQGSAAVFPEATEGAGCSSGKARVEIVLARP